MSGDDERGPVRLEFDDDVLARLRSVPASPRPLRQTRAEFIRALVDKTRRECSPRKPPTIIPWLDR